MFKECFQKYHDFELNELTSGFVGYHRENSSQLLYLILAEDYLLGFFIGIKIFLSKNLLFSFAITGLKLS